MAQTQDPFEHTRMTLGQHLAELRKRLVRGVLAVVLAYIGCWFFYEPLTEVVLRPMRYALSAVNADQVEKYEKQLAQERLTDPSVPRSRYFQSDEPGEQRLKEELTVSERMVMIGLGEGFGFAMKVTLFAALLVGAPVLLWQMWRFIGAGLYAHEQRVVLKYFPISIGLFACGVLFGYFVLCPIGFRFMIMVYPPEKVQLLPGLGQYLSLLTGVTLALGAVFELPLLMYVLVRVGLVERATFAKYRAHFVVAAFIIGGVITPPDPFTQLLVAFPMIGLYELGLLWTLLLRKPKPAAGGAA